MWAMSDRFKRRFFLPLGFLLSLVLSTLYACRQGPDPTPDPRVLAPEPSAQGAGSGALGQVALSVPSVIGNGIGSWTASGLTTITSASPSTLTRGDTFAVYGSSTGTEDTAPSDGFVGRGTVNASGSLSWANGSLPPSAWSAWPFLAAVREAGSDVFSLTIYINGSLGGSSGTGSSGGTTLVNQGSPGDAGAAWYMQLTDGGGGVISPATSNNQVTQITEETSSAFSLTLLAEAAVENGSAFNPASYLLQAGAESQSSGDVVPLLTDSSGALLSNHSSIAPVIATTLVNQLLIKGSSGKHISTLVQVDATAPTATYYVQMVQGSATCPADGAVTFLHVPITVIHVVNTPNTVVFDDTGALASFTTGLCVDLSSSQSTKTSTGLSYILADSSVL